MRGMEKEMVRANPGWVLAGGCVLAFLVAAVNADFMLRLGISVSHLTGDLSRISSEAIEGVRAGGQSEVALLCLSLAGFVLGAAISGFVIHHPNLLLQRPYGRFVMVIGAMLFATGPLMESSTLAACTLAACACGMQNALATRYRGVILRTTHITGLLTDFGQHLGMRLRGHAIESWKISTPLLLSVSFAGGALAGAFLSLKMDASVTGLCGVLYIVGGMMWSIVKRRPMGGE
jgi:uncharacterized membrane protein YoaK (UPF0700 family)